jgi:2'-5' RNA ligase
VSGAALESAILIPVPEAEPLVGALRAEHDPASAAGIPAHVTLLYPFAEPSTIDPATIERVGSVFAASMPFRFVLSATGWFGGEVLSLTPEPREPFVWLTESLTSRFPAFAPYGGAFEEIVPHLTVAMRGSEAMEAEMGAGLPIAATVSEAVLMVEGEDARWTVAERFPLGRRGA